MNRRHFLGLSAFSLAASRLRSCLPPQPPAGRPVRYAVIGLGSVSDIFMRACGNSETAKITALVTGDPKGKGMRYAARYRIDQSSVYSYETFDRIRDDPSVDAVYVGLPNSLHCEYTLRAAAAGKHVLCEKPMAISSAECREMIAACQRRAVKLMIAYRCHFDPCHREAERILQSGALGQLQSFEGAFGFDAAPGAWRLTRRYAGGGAMMDMGIYPLNAMRYFTREEPMAFSATASTRDHQSGRFREVEETLQCTMTFPSGILGSIATSYGASLPGILRIHGDKGSLELSPAFDYKGIRLKGLVGVTAQDASPGDDTSHFKLEAEHFAECIRKNSLPQTPGEEGLKDLLALEAIYRSAGTPIA